MKASEIKKEIKKHFKGFVSVTNYNTKNEQFFYVSQSNISDISFLIPILNNSGFYCIEHANLKSCFLVRA